MNKALLSLALFGAVLTFTSCEKDDKTTDTPSTKTYPTTYEFTRNGESSVSYGGQIDRLNQLNEIGNVLSSVNAPAGTIDAAAVKAMYANEGATWVGTYDATKNLKGKTATAADVTFFEGLIDDMAAVSLSGNTATEGTAGLILKDGSATSGYLVDANGVEYRQIFLKRLMGSVFFNQAIENYLGVDILADDNITVAEGKSYTAMEHHYDEAFGYLGIATNLTNNDLDAKDKSKGIFWGEYLIKRTAASEYTLVGGNEKLLNAFIKGRQSVVDKDMVTLQEAVKEITTYWELVIGLNAISYLEDSKTDTDLAAKLHHLSEAVGFMLALGYHYETGSNALHAPIFSESKVQEALAIVGLNTNMYQLSNTDIDNAITKLNEAFNGQLVK